MSVEDQSTDSRPVTHPRLCDKCQHWSRWELVAAPRERYDDLSYDYLRAHDDCLFCSLVFRAVHARLVDSIPGVIPYSRVQVQVAGPTSVNCGDHPYPGFDSDWNVTKTRYTGRNLVMELWVHVDIKFQQEPGTEPEKEPVAVPRFSPQLQAHFTHDGTLASTEDWDVPYIDLSTVKSWLQCCQQNHGSQCTDSLASNGVCVITNNPSLRSSNTVNSTF